MTGLFGGGATPAVPSAPRMPQTPPVAERSDDQTSALADSQRRGMARRTGRAMTMLTGGGGADSSISAVRLLGGAART